MFMRSAQSIADMYPIDKMNLFVVVVVVGMDTIFVSSPYFISFDYLEIYKNFYQMTGRLKMLFFHCCNPFFFLNKTNKD